MHRSNPPSHPPLAATRQRSASSLPRHCSKWRRPLIAVALAISLAGCSDHPPLERPSYDLAKALYGVCNRQSTEHLAKFDEVLAEAITAGKVGPQEESALREIVQVAADGEWYDAQEMARELIASQNS